MGKSMEMMGYIKGSERKFCDIAIQKHDALVLSLKVLEKILEAKFGGEEHTHTWMIDEIKHHQYMLHCSLSKFKQILETEGGKNEE
jgi:hypothetical protein